MQGKNKKGVLKTLWQHKEDIGAIAAFLMMIGATIATYDSERADQTLKQMAHDMRNLPVLNRN